MRTIKNVNVTKQLGYNIFSFGAPASILTNLCRVERFEDGGEGVNRQLNEKHVLDIATAMSTKGSQTLWLEPFIVALRGKWRYDEAQQMLLGDDDAYLSVDDGQHRIAALQSNLLTVEEMSSLDFTVTATMGIPYDLRLRIFRMQAERRPIDARLDLAQRNRLGEWRNIKDREGYELVLMLSSAPGSPLKDRIQLTEGMGRPRENTGDKSNLINAHGLHATLKMLFGRRSPLHTLLPAKRAEIVTNTIRAAAQIWPQAWNSERHILTTARGINAVLRLFVSGTNFRAIVGIDITEDKIRAGLEAARGYDWEARRNRNLQTDQITEALDETCRRTIQGVGARKDRRTKGSNGSPSQPGTSESPHPVAT